MSAFRHLVSYTQRATERTIPGLRCLESAKRKFMAESLESTHPACPKCGSTGSSRIRRQGIFNRYVAPYLGLFPWECGVCRKTFLARGRGNMQKQNGARSMLVASSGERQLRP